MAELWLACARELEVTEAVLARLPAKRAARVRAIRHPRTQRAMLAAGLLLCRVLGPRAEAIQYTEEGKPYLRGGPQFSLAHGGDYAVLLMAEDACGVDVEPIDRARPGVARAFADGERTAAASAAGFAKLWTRKEAIAKAMGLGLSRALLAVDVRADTPVWHFDSRRVDDHMISSACAPEETIQLRKLDLRREID